MSKLKNLLLGKNLISSRQTLEEELSDVKKENQESVRKGLSDFRELTFNFDYEGAVIL